MSCVSQHAVGSETMSKQKKLSEEEERETEQSIWRTKDTDSSSYSS